LFLGKNFFQVFGIGKTSNIKKQTYAEATVCEGWPIFDKATSYKINRPKSPKPERGSAQHRVQSASSRRFEPLSVRGWASILSLLYQ
jgi:hypothetical protein